jgi:8-oxo-dGTP pyrophosphatase MutT (NUDIX family)
MSEPNDNPSPNRFPIATQVSAGGVAFRRVDSKVEIALILVHPSRRWQLPKGTVDAGETLEQTAVREVREEAGVDTIVVAPLETIEYWFVATTGGIKSKIHKFVHFFLLKYLDGEVTRHDHEVAEARWVSFAEALEMLAFKNEIEVVKKAAELIEKMPDA